MGRPLTRTTRTMRRMGPLTREIQGVQNDLVKLARKLDRLQVKVQEAEAAWLYEQAEARRLQPETEQMIAGHNFEAARAALGHVNKR